MTVLSYQGRHRADPDSVRIEGSTGSYRLPPLPKNFTRPRYRFLSVSVLFAVAGLGLSVGGSLSLYLKYQGSSLMFIALGIGSVLASLSTLVSSSGLRKRWN